MNRDQKAAQVVFRVRSRPAINFLIELVLLLSKILEDLKMTSLGIW